jgi:2-phospho-L-lactate guanylyltransferase
VVPLKTDADAKGRLAGSVALDRRVEVMLALFRRTVAALSAGGLERIVVVARGRAAASQAVALGLEVRDDPGLGPNPAVAAAAAWAADQGADLIAVVAADLPLIDQQSVRLLCRNATGTRMVIGPDRLGAGTNALVTPAGFPYAFGPGSFQIHEKAARRRGWEIVVARTPGLAVDLDEPEDLDIAAAF